MFEVDILSHTCSRSTKYVHISSILNPLKEGKIPKHLPRNEPDIKHYHNAPKQILKDPYTVAAIMPSSNDTPPYRSIRAHFDSNTITLYAAFSTPIATAALSTQRLSASPHFLTTRSTWIKPSFNWMMYRSGYSYKDAGQERILALKMRHEHFALLLEGAGLAEEDHVRGETVIVQWDPERGVRLERLGWRSLQVGVPGGEGLGRVWREEWILGIEDVTDVARGLKRRLDGDGGGDVSEEELAREGLLPVEWCYDGMVGEEVKRRLRIGVEKGS